MITDKNVGLLQSCTTCGTRANCGPQKLYIWPAKPRSLWNYISFFIRNIFCVFKNLYVVALERGKKNFWPAMGLELCTPILLFTNLLLSSIFQFRTESNSRDSFRIVSIRLSVIRIRPYPSTGTPITRSRCPPPSNLKTGRSWPTNVKIQVKKNLKA